MIEAGTLPQIVDLGSKGIKALLDRVSFGHLGSCKDNRPYVVPLHFAYRHPDIFFYTTEGMKTEMIGANPTVCLQVEEIKDHEHWESVMITGRAERLTTDKEIGEAMELIKKVNPQLSPAWSVRWMDMWVRSNIEVVYRITPEITTGRRAFKREPVH